MNFWEKVLKHSSSGGQTEQAQAQKSAGENSSSHLDPRTGNGASTLSALSQAEATANPPQMASLSIWKHAVDNVQAQLSESGQFGEPARIALSQLNANLQTLWLKELKKTLSPTATVTANNLRNVDEARVQQVTQNLVGLIFTYMESLVAEFEPLTGDVSFRMTTTRPQDAPLSETRGKSLSPATISHYRRFRISTSSWSLSVRGQAGIVEVFLLPVNELIRLSENETAARLQFKLILDATQTITAADVWRIGGYPADSAELYLYLKNAFKQLVLKSAGEFDAIASTFNSASNQDSSTQAMRELVIEKQNLAQKLVLQQEQIQSRISQELHDAVISDVMMLKRSITEQRNFGEAKTIAILDQIAQHLREICHDLAPRNLKDWGMQTVIEDLLQTMSERTNAECTLQCQGEIPDLPDAVQLHIFRIVQESLNNIEKYAMASHVNVIINTGEMLIITITDDGIGFQISDTKSRGKEGGKGLGGIRERADLIRCFFPTRLSVESEPGKGAVTKLEIALPKSTEFAGFCTRFR